jgi:RNA polymerase sigma-70 factor, ECF subfamily
MEPGQRVDQFIESIVEAHRGRIVAWWPRDPATHRATARMPYGVDATVRAATWFWGLMDADSLLLAALATDLDGAFEGVVLAHQDRLYSIALRMLGDPRDAEEAAQDALVRAYRALAGYDRLRILELRIRPWLATIVLNLCRSRIGRRVAAGRPALSLDAADPGTLEPPADEHAGPMATTVRRDARRVWGELLLTLPPAYRSAVVLRHVDGLSYPEVATALDRPEGTVKAQVHRGLAMLRTAFEAAQRREREEMTA